jgi:hypothetical protein
MPSASSEANDRSVLLCQKYMGDWRAAEENISQHLYGSDVAFCGVALCESVNQLSQNGDVISRGASNDEFAHRLHAIASLEESLALLPSQDA